MKVPRYTVMPRAISEDIVTQDMGTEVLVYNLLTHRAMSLNLTVVCVWELCDGRRTVSAIRELAEKKLKTGVPEEAVLLALDELNKHDLLIKADESHAPMEPLPSISRRSMIRKVGLTAVVAIPVITAITAPQALHAASAAALKANGANCTNDNECQSSCCIGFCATIDNCFL